MNLGNLMMMKSQMASDSRGESGNASKIRVRVAPVPGTRKLQILPSSSSSSAVVVKSAVASSKAALFCNHYSEMLLQNYANFKKSGAPGRIMFYQNGAWVDFEKEVVEMLKLGFLEGNSVMEGEVDGRNCLFDLHRMLLIEFESANQRSIAWIDIDGKCFFPKVFVDSSEISEGEDVNVKENLGEESPKIEIEIKVVNEGEKSVSSEDSEERDANFGKRKRESNENGEMNSSNFEVKRRQITESEVRKPMWPKTVVLQEEEKEFKVIKNLFLSGVGMANAGARITSIHKCVWKGMMDKARVQTFLKQMELTKRTRVDANLGYAWYGTSASGLETILAHGFGAPKRVVGSPPYGAGVYLSPSRSPYKSAMSSEIDENGERHVVLCRVILGRCEKVELGSRQAYPSSVDYDTGVDDLNNPTCHVVWYANMNTHILPECVVSFKLANRAPVKGGSAVLAAKLLAKLSTSLPSHKVKAMQTLSGLFKAGTLGKEQYLKRLRSVVGDEVLHEAIREVRG